MSKSRAEQIAEFEALPFPVDERGHPTAKCLALVDDRGAVVEVIIASPYSNSIHGGESGA